MSLPSDKSGRLQSFSWFRNEIARRMAGARIGEPLDLAPATAGLDERLAQCIWLDSLLLHAGLKTDSGKALEIRHPGYWNHGQGPDFREARLRIDGRDVRGDVEVHLRVSGWRQHRHHLNREYDNVILHVCLWADEGSRVLNSQGHPIENFTMEPVLFPDLDTIRQTVRVEEYPYQSSAAVGRCQPLMCSLDENFLSRMLDAAGRERLESKAARFADQAAGESLDQVFYQAIMTAMGHGPNKSLFFLLSKRAPLSELLDYLQDLPEMRGGDRETALSKAVFFFQAILLHVAALTPAQDQDLTNVDEQTLEYLGSLREIWRDFEGYFEDRLIPPTRRWTTGVRPVNFAQRRLAGVACLLARHFLGGPVAEVFARRILSMDPALGGRALQKWIKANLIEPFSVRQPEDYWSLRYTFTGKRAAREMKLVGDSRAASIAFNALLPLLLVHARTIADQALEERIWRLFHLFPALDSNAITRHMRTRLFGEDERAGRLLTVEARQQGLFQIFADCCNHNDQDCAGCYYLQARPAS
ncbi:DUF2851 family protein [bacterium]|nr:DUF2851 family protein [bacterium]